MPYDRVCPPFAAIVVNPLKPVPAARPEEPPQTREQQGATADDKALPHAEAGTPAAGSQSDVAGDPPKAQPAQSIAEDPATAPDAAEPDVALLDQSMPMLVGTDVISEAKDAGLTTKFILLTMHAEPFLARQALHAGASGVVLKDDAVEALLDAIRRVHAGEVFMSPSVDADVVKDRDLLTDREREILIWIARGLSNSEVADELGISPRTVDTHRTRMMRKLGTHSVAELVSFAARSGLVQR